VRIQTLAVFIAAFAAAPRCGHAQSQWSAVVSGSAVGFGGASHIVEEQPGLPDQYKPASTVGGGASLRRGFGKASAQLAFLYAKAGAGAYGNGQSAIINPGLSLYQFSLLLGYRVLGTAEGAGLDLRAGPMLQKWGGDFTLTAPSRFGALGAIGVTAPLASGLDLEAEASLGVAGSPFAEPDFAELPADYEAKSTWTRALSLGLALRF
jgi:hypothetical protein